MEYQASLLPGILEKRSDFRITVISAESEHFWSRTALMYIYMGHMKYEHTKPYEDGFWKKNDIDLVYDCVSTINIEEKSLQLTKNKSLTYDALILATGSQPNTFNWPGQDAKGVCTMVSLQDLENIQKHSANISKAVIVGGGLIGVEMAEMLRSKSIHTTFLVREKRFWNNTLPEQEADLVGQHILKHEVDLRLSSELNEIITDNHGQVKGVVTSTGETIECQFVGITAGVHPNIDLVKNTDIKTNKGILVNQFLQTNIPDVYAIGDCAEQTQPTANRSAIEQVWYTGKIMGETVAQTICGSPKAYQPGPWYNSAKFFDLEYQTYGNVPNSPQPDEKRFYWQHPSGSHALHFSFQAKTNIFLGVNSIGIRLRHNLFDNWLREEASIQHVIKNLKAANFDPEFFTSHEKEITDLFNQQYPELKVEFSKRKRIAGIF
ncbi:NAD(P)/FAD-dependent oxidoreductase [Fulvivirga maritima]|uniref:NAD(P)/FAD-dependent oxidoreductase n=1 Tax=Fulvivirga maritima TaxID=2904247 RepID=UPI002795D9E0|nr:FAD-dependent oxidoreductase [Fulvivirga maritima]